MSLLDQFPGPVIIRPNRFLLISIATVTLAVSVGLAFTPPNIWQIGLSIGLGGLALVGFYVAVSNNYLKLDAEGFEYKWSFSRLKKYNWTHASNFEAHRGSGSPHLPKAMNKWVQFDNGVPYFQRAWGAPRIPLGFNYNVEELADLMNRWRERALASRNASTL